MEFRLLGPVEAREGERRLDLGPPKQRALLALLLLARGPISVSRAIDELWEEPPSSAPKMVQMYASGLRRVLGQATIRTIPSGYELEQNGHGVDLDRFRELCRRAQGAPDSAQMLRAALDLWRGEALADLAGEPFAIRERARLEEERLAALEARLEAELSTGSGDQVGELQTLVAQHPYRERLRMLLILALYRSGRQAAALGAYRDAARTLRRELGLEPTRELRELESAILRQDEALDAPRRPKPFARSRVRVRALVIAVGAAIALAVATAALLHGSRRSSAVVVPNTLTALDVRSGEVAAQVPVGLRPTAIAAANGRVFVANGDDRTVWALDASTGARLWAAPVDAAITSLSATRSTVWGVEFLNREVVMFAVADAGTATTVAVPSGLGRPAAVAATPAGAWIGTDEGIVLFATNGGSIRRLGKIELPIRAVAYKPPFLWLVAPLWRGVTGADELAGSVVRFDLRTKSGRSIPLGIDPSAAVAARNGVWAADQQDGKVVRLAGETAAVDMVVHVPSTSMAEGPCSAGLITSCAGSIAFAGGDVWIPSARGRRLFRIDGRTGDVATIPTVGAPVGVAASGGRLWVVAD